MADPLAGVLIGTRYRLIGQLGPGGSGTVWDARDEQLDLAVAIKELRPPEPAPDGWLAEKLQMLTAEARYTGQLTHPSIVAVYDVVSDLDRPWVIMPRVSGRSLAAEIATGGAWEPARAMRLALHLVQALETAHAENVTHGAVKPSNVLIPEFGVPMLTDFSLTPSSREADLLGLGRTLYFAVEGHDPESLEPEPPQNAGPITALIEGLLAADPDERLALTQVREQLTTAIAEFTAQRKAAQASLEADAPADNEDEQDEQDDENQEDNENQENNEDNESQENEENDEVPSPWFTSRAPETAPEQAPEEAPESASGVAEAPPAESVAPKRRRLTKTATAVTVAVIAVVAVAAFAFVRPFGIGHGRPLLIAADPVPDTTAPQQPMNVTVSGRSTDTVTLMWDAAVDNVGVTEYRIQRDGVQAGTTATNDYTDNGLAVDTTYTYTLTALDAAGNVSAPSAPVTATTLKIPDITKPSTPGNLRVISRSTTSIVLGWTAATDDVGVARYEVRRDGRTVARPTGTRFTDNNLSPGTSYSYVMVAVDATGNVSDPTQPVTGATLTAAVTTPPSSPRVSGINAEVSIGTPPACTVTITATVAVTAGPVTVNLQVTINGATSSTSVTFPGAGPASQTVTIGTAPGTQDGTVQVSSTSLNPVSSTKTWTAPDACLPGFTVGSPTAQAGSCDSPTIGGSVRITVRNNPGAQGYTVQMLVDGGRVAETTVTLTPNSSEVVSLVTPDPYPNGTYAVSYVVVPQSGPSATSSTVTVQVDC